MIAALLSRKRRCLSKCASSNARLLTEAPGLTVSWELVLLWDLYPTAATLAKAPTNAHLEVGVSKWESTTAVLHTAASVLFNIIFNVYMCVCACICIRCKPGSAVPFLGAKILLGSRCVQGSPSLVPVYFWYLISNHSPSLTRHHTPVTPSFFLFFKHASILLSLGAFALLFPLSGAPLVSVPGYFLLTSQTSPTRSNLPGLVNLQSPPVLPR